MRRIMCAAFIVLTETAATANAEKWGDDEYFIDRASPEDAAATKPTFHKSPNTKYKKEKNFQLGAAVKRYGHRYTRSRTSAHYQRTLHMRLLYAHASD